MAKFLNKKEQIIHLQLTPYGKYRLSTGNFKPTYYSFMDDGVLYDSQYAGFSESPTNVHNRIKNETQFLESVVVFDELETSVSKVTIKADHESWDPAGLIYEGAGSLATSEEKSEEPRKDMLKFSSLIGDAAFDGPNQQSAPAWKIVTLQGTISSSAPQDIFNEEKIPQLNVELNYTKRIRDPRAAIDPKYVDSFIDKTDVFSDGRVIELIEDDMVVYADELNTELFTENFDIEVFDVETQEQRNSAALVKIGCRTTDCDDYSLPPPRTTLTVPCGPGGPSAGYTFEFLSASQALSARGNIKVVLYEGPYPMDFESFSEKEKFFFKLGFTGANFIRAIDTQAPLLRSGDAGWWGFSPDKPPWCIVIENTAISTPTINTNLPLSASSTPATSRIITTGFVSGTTAIQTLKRKYFEKQIEQIIGGFMQTPNPQENMNATLHSSSVEYYFDILTDKDVDEDIACRGAESFNKSSYYIDLDFDCDKEEEGVVFYDIYGSEVGDPEICQ